MKIKLIKHITWYGYGKVSKLPVVIKLLKDFTLLGTLHWRRKINNKGGGHIHVSYFHTLKTMVFKYECELPLLLIFLRHWYSSFIIKINVKPKQNAFTTPNVLSRPVSPSGMTGNRNVPLTCSKRYVHSQLMEIFLRLVFTVVFI